MAATLTLDDVRRAWDARDPELPRLIAHLAEPARPRAGQARPRRGADVRPRSSPSIATAAVPPEAEGGAGPLPRRDDQGARSPRRRGAAAGPAAAPRGHPTPCGRPTTRSPGRACCEVIATVPLAYGPWRALKRIFKEAEAKPRHRGLRRPGRPVRRGVRAGGYGGRSARRRSAYLRPPGVAVPAPGRRPAAGHLRRRGRRLPRPLHRRHQLARHLGRQPHLLPRGEEVRPARASTSATATTRPGPAEGPGVRRPVAAEPAAAVRAAGAGAGRRRSASSPPRR